MAAGAASSASSPGSSGSGTSTACARPRSSSASSWLGWRTLIGAELVFGASSGSGGLGWFIYENSQNLETAHVFAGLFTVILIGITVENVIFRNVELRTVYRWGMQR